MVMAAYTFQPGGLLIGDGTFYIVTSVTGLDGPQVITHDIPSISGGVLPARDVPASRTINFTVEIQGTPGSDLEGKIEAWASAWAPTNTDTHMPYRLDGQTLDRYVIGRPRAWTSTLDQPATQGIRKVVAMWFCPVGTIFDSTNTAVNF